MQKKMDYSTHGISAIRERALLSVQTMLGVWENLMAESLDENKNTLINLLNPFPLQKCNRYLNNKVLFSGSAEYPFSCFPLAIPIYVQKCSLCRMVFTAVNGG